jgi:hypothetical protein
MPRLLPVCTGAERGRRAIRIITHVALTFDGGQNEGRYQDSREDWLTGPAAWGGAAQGEIALVLFAAASFASP